MANLKQKITEKLVSIVIEQKQVKKDNGTIYQAIVKRTFAWKKQPQEELLGNFNSAHECELYISGFEKGYSELI